MPVNFNYKVTSERRTMCTSFDFGSFSLGGTEILTELASCACTISSSLFGFYEWNEITGKCAKTEKKQEILSTLKWNIMITVSIFPHHKCMQWQGKCHYLCQTCLFLLSRSSTAREVRWQGLCKLIIRHWLLSKELQTRFMTMRKFKYHHESSSVYRMSLSHGYSHSDLTGTSSWHNKK